jgi:hypothetical protein
VGFYGASQKAGKKKMIKAEKQLLGIFSGFPARKIKGILDTNAPTIDWNASRIEKVWNFYRDAVAAGQEIYGPGNTEIVNWIVEKSGYPLGEVRLVLYTIYAEVKAGNIEPYFLTLVKPESGKISLENILPGQQLKEHLSNLKWLGFIALAGIGLYFAWPMLTKARSRSKKGK